MSVLVTAYQHEPYIGAALDGLLAQRTPGFTYEVLVGDDGSTDGTREVIERYAAAHPGLIGPLLPPGNLGHEGRALFAQLIGRARGDYVAWLDGDDFWTSPSKLERQVGYLESNPGCAMAFHNAIRRHDDGSVPDRRFNRWRRPRDVGMAEILRHNLVAALSPMFRRSAIDPLPDWYLDCPWGDWPLYVIAAQRGTIHYSGEIHGVYRIHGRGMYSALDRVEILRRHTRFYEQVLDILGGEHQARGRQMLAASLAAQALEQRRSGDRDAARESLEQSFRIWPAGVRRGTAVRAEVLRLLAWVRTRAT